MDDLVNISVSQGKDTVLRGTSQVGGYWDYFIEGTVTVKADDVLYIQPGERLVFRPDFDSTLAIEGQLDASGQAADDIILTSVNDYLVNIKGVQLIGGWTNTFDVWMTFVSEQPDGVFFNGAPGVRQGSVSQLDSAREWYWSESILYVYGTSNPDTAYSAPGVEIGYLPLPAGVSSGFPQTVGDAVSPEEDAEEELFEAALTSDLTTHKGIFAITSVSGVTGPAPGDWYALTFRDLKDQRTSVVRYVTIRGADIGISCLRVPENTLTIERCTIEWNHTGISLVQSTPLIQDNRNISYNLIEIDALGRIVRRSGSAIYMEGGSNPLIRRNTFIGNQGNVILISGKGATPVTPLPRLGSPFGDVGGNNFLIHYNDPPFNTEAGRVGQRHIYNETRNIVYALYNYWGTTDPSYINSTLIYDDTQDSESGEVVFQPFSLRPRTAVAEETWRDYR